ncbi:MAG: hypothetical protein P9L99_05055 [Candidatus Lernaella stagnicola]|nr:hypothetical protein [Candidatus Lernaella stagnicola]
MRLATTKRALWGALFVVLLLAGPAWAQQETDGIRFGAFSIHPSLFSALRYNDNVYFVRNDYQPEDERSIPQSIEGDFVLNVAPSIYFDVTVPTFQTRVGYRFYNDNYLGYDDPDNRHDDLNASNHTFSGLIDYNAPFGLMIGAKDDYTIMETYEETEQFVDYLRGEQIHNDARGWLGFRYGMYDNIYFKSTYIHLLDEYNTYEEYNKTSQYVDGELRLKFFPRTAVVTQGGYGMVDYEQIQAFDSTAWYAMGGLQGQITSHLLMMAKGGWQTADYQENDDFTGWLAQGELTAIFLGNTQWTFGYRRFFRDAANTNYYTSHEGYTRFARLWGSRFNTDAYVSYQYNDFSAPNERHEDFIQGTLDLSYRLVYWLYVGGGYRLEHRVYDDDEVRETSTRNTLSVNLQAVF